ASVTGPIHAAATSMPARSTASSEASRISARTAPAGAHDAAGNTRIVGSGTDAGAWPGKDRLLGSLKSQSFRIPQSAIAPSTTTINTVETARRTGFGSSEACLSTRMAATRDYLPRLASRQDIWTSHVGEESGR